MFYIYKDMGSIIAALKNKKWRLVNGEIAAFKGVEIVYVRTIYGKEVEEIDEEETPAEIKPKKTKAKAKPAVAKEPKAEETKVETPVEEPKAEEVAEATEVQPEVAEEVAEEQPEVAEEVAEEQPEVAEEVAEVTEEAEEVPLETAEEEAETALMEEGSLDGTAEEVEELAAEVEEETPEVSEETETEIIEEAPAEEAEKEPETEAPAEKAEEAEEEKAEEVAEEKSEEKAEPKKEGFKLSAPENVGEIMSKMCTKRARKLIYRPNEELFSMTCEVLGTDKNNEEKISVKKILEEEIKEGVKLGYLDKFDGLSGSELKEEYENDTVYEFAEQEFKRAGILFDGKQVKVYIYDWDMKACHHIGYIADEFAEKVKPYMLDSEKYSFDVNGIITGGKYKKIIKDAETGKITVEKGNDGKLGVELDVTIINRKD